MLRIWSLASAPGALFTSHRFRVPSTVAACGHQVVVASTSNVSNRNLIPIQDHTKRVTGVRREAVGWYNDEPPSPMEAAVYFAERAERDSTNRSLYAEALGLFLATCWNIHPYQQRVA